MQHLEVSGAVRPIYGSLGVKRLNSSLFLYLPFSTSDHFVPPPNPPGSTTTVLFHSLRFVIRPSVLIHYLLQSAFFFPRLATLLAVPRESVKI